MIGVARVRIALLILAASCLAAGVLGGLMRLGATVTAPYAAALHGLLMASGFLGTVISLERAVALGAPLAYVSPLASAVGALLFLAGLPEVAAPLLLLGPAALIGASIAIVRRQVHAHTVLLAIAAVAWLVGNALFVSGAASDTPLPWWFAFLVLTIAAERLEMTRLMPRRRAAAPLFAAAVALLLGGCIAGPVYFGAALVAIAAWLATFDIARRTIRTSGLARYAACALLTGYAWLAVAGFAWMALGERPALRDVALHALALGFVFSMIFAHGPIIVPAIARVRVRFTPLFYAPLAVLHASLALRLLAETGSGMRLAGGALNAIAIGLFIVTLLASLERART